MTRESCARCPQVTQGVNKICSQFVLCRIIEGGKHYMNMLKFKSLPFALGFLFTIRPAGFHFSFICALTISDLIVTNVLRGISELICCGSNGYFNWTARDIKSTTKTPDTASERKPSNPTSLIKPQGQRESVSIGTGITDLGGIGKTNSKQVYYIWRAIFTASTKRTQKVLYLTI